MKNDIIIISLDHEALDLAFHETIHS